MWLITGISINYSPLCAYGKYIVARVICSDIPNRQISSQMLRDMQKTEFKMFGVKAFYNRQLPYSPPKEDTLEQRNLYPILIQKWQHESLDEPASYLSCCKDLLMV